MSMTGRQPQDGERAGAPLQGNRAADANDDEEGGDPHQRAEEAYRKKRFLTAFHLAPDRYASLKGIDTPSMTVGMAWRSKSGTKGTSRLEQWSAIASASTSRGEDVFRLGVHVLSLESGTPREDEAIGSSEERLFRPTNRLDAGVEPSIGWYREGAVSPSVELGTTPLNGILSPRYEAVQGLPYGSVTA